MPSQSLANRKCWAMNQKSPNTKQTNDNFITPTSYIRHKLVLLFPANLSDKRLIHLP